jgi:RimJ/RimL family protein N-acetyltransferase
MRIERTTDLALIKSVFLHPEIADKDMERLMPFPIADVVYWLVAYDGDSLVGCVSFFPLYGVAWNPHIGILPEHRGKGTEVMRECVRWMFENSQARKILAFPFRPIMQRVYEKCGFRVEGFSPKLIDFYGTLTDCQIVGIEK